MPLPRETIDNLIESLSHGWDGCASDEDATRIEAIVREHGSEGGKVIADLSSLHMELHRLVASAKLYEGVMDRVLAVANLNDASIAAPIPRNAETPSAVLATPTGGGLLQNRVVKFTLLAAVSLVAVVTLRFLPLGELALTKGASSPQAAAPAERARLIRPKQPVACVVSLENAVWKNGDDIAVGGNLKQGRKLKLVRGNCQLSMAYGADLALQGPCTVTLTDDDEVRLEVGSLTAQAAPWATGFVVTTDDLRVTDLGTQFAVSIDDTGVVEAHVLEGEILAEPMKHRRPRTSSMLLASGQGIRVDSQKSSVDLLTERRLTFASIDEFKPLRPILMQNTGVGLQPGDVDPHWRLVSGSREGGPYPRQAVVTLGDTGSYKDNKPEVSQWISVAEEGYPGVPPESVHTFETQFMLEDYDLDTVCIIGQFLVDDAVKELRINEKPVQFDRWGATWNVFDFKSFHPIKIADGFVEGENVISVDVFNAPSNPKDPHSHQPTGLRVEWQAFGRKRQD